MPKSNKKKGILSAAIYNIASAGDLLDKLETLVDDKKDRTVIKDSLNNIAKILAGLDYLDKKEG